MKTCSGSLIMSRMNVCKWAVPRVLNVFVLLLFVFCQGYTKGIYPCLCDNKSRVQLFGGGEYDFVDIPNCDGQGTVWGSCYDIGQSYGYPVHYDYPFCGCPSDYSTYDELASCSLPGYLGSSYSMDWGKQGTNVVVVDCGCIIPAECVITLEKTQDILIETFEVCLDSPHIVPCTGFDINFTPSYPECHKWRSDYHYFSAVFDPNVFVVNNLTASPGQVGTSIKVSLVNADCETLKKAMNSSVQIYWQKFQQVWLLDEWSGGCAFYGGSEAGGPARGELLAPQLIATIGVKFVPSGMMEYFCDDPQSPKLKSSSGGCSGGGCDASGSPEMTIGHASVTVNSSQDVTLGVYGSPGFYLDMLPLTDAVPEVNAAGAWVRTSGDTFVRDRYSFDCSYEEQPDGTVTEISISFAVKVRNIDTYYYAYTESGVWPYDPNDMHSAKRLAWDATRGKIQLQRIERVINGTPRNIRTFEYYSSGNLEKQISYDENSQENGYIRYGYENSAVFGSPLNRIWAGADPCDYTAFPDSPSGGRWMDVNFISIGGQPSPRLQSVETPCSDCAPRMIYEWGGADGNQITAIKKMALDEQSQPVEVVLERFEYDSQNRFTARWLGDEDLLVTRWERSDFNPAEPNETTGNNILVRRDFVDNTHYRARVFMANDNGALKKEIHYHNLQEYDPQSERNWLTGPYSIYSYDYDGNIYITTYPGGNKLCKYHDSYGNVIKVQWDGASEPEVQYQYQWGDPPYKLSKEINAYGGETTYQYSYYNKNLTKRMDPFPVQGISDLYAQQITEYEYDSCNRLTLEKRKDASNSWVSTKYEHDVFGNLTKRIEGYNPANPADGLATEYIYNEYNELVTIIEPGGKTHRKFYSESGTLTAEAVYADPNTFDAVSATVYVYENGRLVAQKTADMDEPFEFTGSEDNITWVTEAYEYDDYGRRTAVIADKDGEHSVTFYEYNNQDEVILVLKPDQRYQRTIRDGRGLVSMEITGVKVGNDYQDKAITRFFYDLNGNLIGKVDPEGITESYQYDLKDRLIRSRRGR